jgi:hypothetical protein
MHYSDLGTDGEGDKFLHFYCWELLKLRIHKNHLGVILGLNRQ